MDSATYGDANEEFSNIRVNSRNSHVKRGGISTSKTISNSQHITSDKPKCCFSHNQTLSIADRVNLSIDEHSINSKFNPVLESTGKTKFTIKDEEQILSNKIVHEGITNNSDRDYITSIMHSKSLSNGVRMSSNNSKPSESGIKPKVDIDAQLLDKSELVVNKDVFDMESKTHCQRRVSEKLKTTSTKEDRKYHSNNSIIELQKMDDKRYITCKTRVIPNSEWSTPKKTERKIESDK